MQLVSHCQKVKIYEIDPSNGYQRRCHLENCILFCKNKSLFWQETGPVGFNHYDIILLLYIVGQVSIHLISFLCKLPFFKHLFTGNLSMGTLTNSEDPVELQHSHKK